MADPTPDAPLTQEDVDQDILALEIQLADLQTDRALLVNSPGDKSEKIEVADDSISKIEEALIFLRAMSL